MSTATEIARLSGARDVIRDKLIELGLAASTDKLDVLATAIDGIVNRGAVSATVQEGDTYTIPAGYHNGSGTVTGVAGGGNYTLQSKTATPTKSQQSITPDNGYYGLSSVTVAPIPEAYQNVSSVTATAADVLSPKVIVDATGATLTGTMANNGAVSRTLDATTGNQSYTVPAGYHNGSGKVNVVLETKSATPTKSSQDVTPTSGKVLGKVTVAAIPAAYQDVTNVDATAADVLSGKVIVDATGAELTGSMPNRGAVSKTLDATEGNQSYTVPAGYHNGSGKVSIVLENQTATPTKSSQDITPASGKVLGKVTVGAIPAAYQDVTNVDAAAGDVLDGKIIVAADGTEVTGTMPNNGAVDVTLSTATTSYTVPAGYHSGTGKVKIVTETKTATPSGSSQTISPTSGKVLSKVTVAAVPAKYGDTTGDDATAADILQGVVAHSNVNGSSVKLTGTMPNNGALGGSLDATTGKQSYSIPAGYTSGGSVTITLEEKSATPSASAQNITPTTGKVLSKVAVAAIPANWGNTTGDDGVAANVLAGVKVHSNLNGSAVAITGSMANNGAISGSIDGLTNMSYSVPGGYTSGGTVSLTSDIEDALAAI